MAEWREWDLTGLQVTQLRIDFQFHVHMWTLQRDLLVSFGVPFTFNDTLKEYIIDPENSAQFAPLLYLVFQPVKRFAISSEENCTLEFMNGSQLRAEPHKKYEAWISRGTGNLVNASFFCDIGGDSPWS